jgi:hypothetical protein
MLVLHNSLVVDLFNFLASTAGLLFFLFAYAEIKLVWGVFMRCLVI